MSAFPWGTFLINLVGCTLPTSIAFSFSGCTSKNTVFFPFTWVFSAFTSETAYLFYDNEITKAAWNAVPNGRGRLLGALIGRFRSPSTQAFYYRAGAALRYFQHVCRYIA